MRLALRFDMRAPDIGVAPAVLYPASVDMCEWGDRLGFETVYLAEHHGADDGYCPAPMIQASAILARTERMRVHFSALIAVLHDPLRLAEDLAVLDLISGGRIEMTLGIGYRPHEYEMFGVERSQRVPLLEEIIRTLDAAWTGEPFEFRGRTVTVRPTPVQKPRPPIYIGGSAEASAYRAARLGDGYQPAAPGLFEIYQDELRRLGKPVPEAPRARGPLFLFVTDDPERDWPVVAPHVIYTSSSNFEWAKERGVGSTPYPAVATVEDLKASDKFAVVTPDECVALATSLPPDAELTFQPLMGALDPAVSWRSLHLFESAVLPRLVDAGLRPSLSGSADRPSRIG
jgi:alkanesulfonate monooxygenase SsuD/methylene tetrahydromethanopterin reductase-like flavin-dependent oxidoreductase (luciferase family)